MIGSFWNLCRACPSMPIDKLHSEYRSTYTWHEYTGANQEYPVVRRAPQPPSTNDTSAKLQSAKSIEDENNEGTSLEPPLPRRKKCPELAYRTHEFISATNAANGGGADTVDSNIVADKVREVTKTLPTSQLSRAISRISTEYRLQFAWPRRQQLMNGDLVTSNKDEVSDEQHQQQQEQQQVPKKSLSMGALKQSSIMPAPVPVHKKRQVASIDHRRNGAQASELEPLVAMEEGALPESNERNELDATDIKMPLKKNGSRVVRITEQPFQDNKFRKTQERPFSATEVIELRRELKRLADEYKHRDWGGGMASEDEATLWKHVSNNHVLNALSLARSATKEEKDKENTKKVGPAGHFTGMTVLPAGRPSSVQARPISAALPDDFKPDNDKALVRARKDFLIRHHLDRTTGTGDGALIPSPTREKLEPAMPRRRDDQNDIQPRSKSSPKNSPRSGRSQSVGPTAIERRSPKRQLQRPSPDTKDTKESKDKQKEVMEKISERERHPRPMTAEPQVNGQHPHQDQEQQQPWTDNEPVVKSPPEPTRVKSPEQMIMRSPEPVNWTVPLDTGKTFTVTQNVREGEPSTRAHSETRSWQGVTGSSGQTPDLAGAGRAQQKLNEHKQQQQLSGYKSPESESISIGSFSGTNGHKEGEDSLGERDSPLSAIAKDEMNQEVRYVEKPIKCDTRINKNSIDTPITMVQVSTTSQPPQEHLTSDLLEKARNRFDKFWGSGKSSE